METIFQDMVDAFGEKTDLVDDLLKELKSLSHEKHSLKVENVGLKTQSKIVEDMF
jgi:hypothetical protein